VRGAAWIGPVALLSAAVAAADQASVAMPTVLAARVETSREAGLAVEIESRSDGALVTLSQTVRALRAEPAYPLAGIRRCDDPAALDVPRGFAVPAELASAAERLPTAAAVVERAVVFVTRRVRLDEDDAGPQDGPSVLARGRGRCSGRANLAVGLLRGLGIPARVVQGLLLGREGPRWHRWGEAWLGGAGWVPFDPGASVGIVSVRYLPLRGSGGGSSLAGVRVERLDERGFLGVPVRDGLRVLPARGVTVRCVAPAGQGSVTAALVGPDGSRWVRRGVREVVFDRMLPGRYRIVWGASGRPGVLDLVLGAAPEVLVELGARGEAGS